MYCTFTPPRCAQRAPELFASLITAIRTCASQHGASSDFTVIDDSILDGDEYDTDWSSVEVLLSVPVPWSPRTHFQFSKSTRSALFTFACINMRQEQRQRLGRQEMQLVFQFVVERIWEPVFRLHRSTVPPTERVIPVKFQQECVLGICAQLIGMGKVNEFTDAGDGEEPCEAALDKKDGMEKHRGLGGFVYSPMSLPYVQPIYFRCLDGRLDEGRIG
jgi:hypothetical protein